MPGPPQSAVLRYRPELDGVRAIAVYLVVAFHAGLGLLTGGFVGVDLFFVLSGFLVSGVILREVDERGTFALGGFYARRVRRLLPAAVLVIVATAAVQVLLTSVATRVDLIGDARASLLYVANWHSLLTSGDYFAQDADPSPFLHFWSLAIEEQFYLLFPLLVLLVLRVARRPARALALAVGVLGLGSLALQVWRAQGDPGYAYYATETRVYQLLAGVALMLVVRRVAHRRSPGRRSERRGEAAGRASFGGVAGPAGAAGLVGLLLVGTSYVALSPSVRGILATVASVALIAGLWSAPTGLLSRVLARPTPRYLGQISYATYLWHWPVILVLRQVLDAEPWVLTVLAAALATALAALSGQLLETPLRRSPVLDRLPARGWPVVAGGLALSVLAAALVVPPVLQSERRPALAASTAVPAATNDTSLRRPVPDLDYRAVRADVGDQTDDPCTVEDPDACTVVEGEGPHVLLMGDSQAMTFVPALTELATEQDLTFSTNVQPGCPWQAGQVNDREGSVPERQEACRVARAPYLTDVLPLMDVDVVLAVGLSRSDDFWDGKLTSPDGPPDETLAELQQRTTQDTAGLVTDAGADLVIAHSVFGTDGYSVEGFNPLECLASADSVGECAVLPPLGRPAVDDVYGFLDTADPDVATIDLVDVVCPDRPQCSPVQGDTVVWKDRDHVTSRFYVEQRAALWERLVATGLLS